MSELVTIRDRAAELWRRFIAWVEVPSNAVLILGLMVVVAIAGLKVAILVAVCFAVGHFLNPIRQRIKRWFLLR